jgi:hypothetical protein
MNKKPIKMTPKDFYEIFKQAGIPDEYAEKATNAMSEHCRKQIAEQEKEEDPDPQPDGTPEIPSTAGIPAEIENLLKQLSFGDKILRPLEFAREDLIPVRPDIKTGLWKSKASDIFVCIDSSTCASIVASIADVDGIAESLKVHSQIMSKGLLSLAEYFRIITEDEK